MDDDTRATAKLIEAYEIVLGHQVVERHQAELLLARTDDFIRCLQVRLETVRDTSDPQAEKERG